MTLPDDRRIKAERDAALSELEALRKKFQDLEKAHAQLQTAYNEVVNKTGYKESKPYEYKEDECRPLSVGEVCDKCGYDYRPDSERFMMRPNDKVKESHAIKHH